MKLPKKIKAKWLKALRSGEYRQGRGRMYKPDTASFCCLGVLQHTTHRGCVEAQSTIFKAMPSREYWDSIGAKEVDSDVYDLAIMNDKGVRFKTIANWIEKNIEGY